MHMYGLTITQRTHSLLTLIIHNDWGRHTLPHKHVKLFICWPILIEAASPVRWGSPSVSASLLLPFFLLLLFMSLQIVSTQSFVLYQPPSRFCIGWAEPTFLIVHLQEIQSSHQTWPPRPIYPCSLLFSASLSPSSSVRPLFFSASSVKDRGLGPAGDAEWRLWSGRKLRKVADRLLELIICSRKGRTVAQSVKQTVEAVHYK